MTDTNITKIIDEIKDEPIVVKKGDIEVVLTEGRVRELTSKYIEECGKEAAVRNDFGMNAKVVTLLIDLKKAYWPATNKNLNVNVDSFDKQLELWMKARDAMSESNKPDIVVELQ